MATDTMQKSVIHYENMRDSGVEWIGKIPSHWKIRKIKYLATKPGTCFTDGDWINSTDISAEGIRYLTTGNIGQGVFKEQGNGFITEDTFRKLGCFEAHSGDLVISRLNSPIGRACILPSKYERCVVAVDNVVLRPNAEYLKEFLMYAMSTDQYSEYTLLLSRGTTMSRISRTQLGNIPLPIAPIEEQSKIVNYLNHYCKKINSVIYEIAHTIKDYKTWESIIIHEAITKGLNPNIEMKDSGVEWIGKIPVAWSACALKRLTIKIGSGKTPLGGAETYISQGVLFLRSQNIYDTGLRLDNASYISPEVNESMGNTQVEYGDVLLNITGGSIGRCCVYDLNGVAANVNQHVCIIRTQYETLRPQYLRYFWNSAAGPMIISHYQTGGNRPGLNFEQIGSVKIPLCDVAVQDSIVKYLDKKTRKIDELIQEKEDLITDLESYKKSLIYEVVTGKRKVV